MPREGLIEGQIADLDFEEPRLRGGQGGPRRLATPRRAGTGARTVLREKVELMPAGELGVLGYPGAAVEDHELAGTAQHLDRLADEGERDRIAIGVDIDQVVLGHDAGQARLEPEARLAGRRDQVRLLLREALARPLMGRAMDPHVGDGDAPLGQLLVQIDVVHEGAAGQEIALEVLHPRLDLAFGLGAVRLADARLEAPVLGEGLEGGVPDNAAFRGAETHRARPVVEMLAGVAAEILECPLVSIEKLRQRLVRADVVVTPPTEAQREHEHVTDVPLMAKRYGGRAPIDLALLARGRLEAPERQLTAPLGRPEWTDEELDRLVTPGVAVLTEFLKQNLGGVPDLWGAFPQVCCVRRQPRTCTRRTLVRPPRWLPHAPPDGLTIQSELTGQFRDRHPLVHRQTVKLFPSLPTDHRHLLA